MTLDEYLRRLSEFYVWYRPIAYPDYKGQKGYG
jgi:hypothetical protein